jgi:hypothetical protein
MIRSIRCLLLALIVSLLGLASAGSADNYLASALPAQGALLENYYAIGHWGLDNYIALVGGQGPNAATQRDCMQVIDFRLQQPNLDSHGQALGFGCVYPSLVKTLPGQLDKAGLTCGTKQGPPGPFIAAFLQEWVPLITHSAAFRRDGLLIITFAQSDGRMPRDYEACCGEMPMSADPDKAGFRGPGGGKVGAVALSPFIRAGTISTAPYNHYSLLRTVEDIFGLEHLGFAAQSGLRPLDSDVFTR